LSLFIGQLSCLKITQNKEVSYSIDKQAYDELRENKQVFDDLTESLLLIALRGERMTHGRVKSDMKTVDIVRIVKGLATEVIEDVYQFLVTVLISTTNPLTCLYTAPSTARVYSLTVDLFN
jgi:hypothetical protein